MKAPATPRAFRSAAVRVFKKANPGLTNLTIEWQEVSRVPRWANGSSGFRGSFVVSADGYRSQVMYATWCGGLMVRPI